MKIGVNLNKFVSFPNIIVNIFSIRSKIAKKSFYPDSNVCILSCAIIRFHPEVPGNSFEILINYLIEDKVKFKLFQCPKQLKMNLNRR